MRFVTKFAALIGLMSAAPAMAQTAPPPPKLLVVVSVDQFSADLFAEYRGRFRGGFARLLSGGVFPAGYQSHASTETCPGHSTILTGARPARTGIVANDWIDLKLPREDKTIYCAEDTSVPGSSSTNYTVSDKNLKVPTLGEWMKLANPASRVFSIAGKDRAAVMMGGHKVDELWWWGGKSFVSYAGRTEPEMVTKVNAMVTERVAAAQEAMAVPEFCKARDRAVSIGGGKTLGDYHFAREAGDVRGFRASPEFDDAIVTLAAGLATKAGLGKGAATDLLIVGASATDYIGHTYGVRGAEMCIQLHALDETLGRLFAVLDREGIDYAVALTADHGGLDATERSDEQAAPDAARADIALSAATVGKAIAAELKLDGQLLWGGMFGDIYIDPKLTPQQRAQVIGKAMERYSAHPQVRLAMPTNMFKNRNRGPVGPPETWSLDDRIQASFDPERSGDLYIVLKPRVMPIPDPTRGYTATHGSIWDYDRRVPILFWRKGMTGFEQPLGVETVDIAPTLAALIGVKVPVEIDGRCLDLDAGAGTTCP